MATSVSQKPNDEPYGFIRDWIKGVSIGIGYSNACPLIDITIIIINIICGNWSSFAEKK